MEHRQLQRETILPSSDSGRCYIGYVEERSDSGLSSLRGSAGSSDERSSGSRGSVFSGSEEAALSSPNCLSVGTGGLGATSGTNSSSSSSSSCSSSSSSSLPAPFQAGPSFSGAPYQHQQQHHPFVWRDPNLLFPYPTEAAASIIRHVDSVQHRSLLMSHSVAVSSSGTGSSSAAAATVSAAHPPPPTIISSSPAIVAANPLVSAASGAMLTPHPVHPLVHPPAAAVYSQMPDILWKQRYPPGMPSMTGAHIHPVAAEDLLDKERVALAYLQERERIFQREQKETEKLKEKYQERERAEKERLEKEIAAQEVHKHFEESLRLAHQKHQRNRNLITTLTPPTTSSTTNRNDDDRKRIEHEQQQRIIRPEPREKVPLATFTPYSNTSQKLPGSTGNKLSSDYIATSNRIVGSGTGPSSSSKSQMSLPKSEPNYAYNHYPILQNPLNFLPNSSSASSVGSGKSIKSDPMKKSPGAGILTLPLLDSRTAAVGDVVGGRVLFESNSHASSSILNVPTVVPSSSVIVKNDCSSKSSLLQQQQHQIVDNGSSSHSGTGRQIITSHSSSSSPSTGATALVNNGKLRTDSSSHYLQPPPTNVGKSYEYRSPTQSPLQVAHSSVSPVAVALADHHQKIGSHHRNLTTHRRSPHQQQQQQQQQRQHSPLPSQSPLQQVQQRHSPLPSLLQSSQLQQSPHQQRHSPHTTARSNPSPPDQRYPANASSSASIVVYPKQSAVVPSPQGSYPYANPSINSQSSSGAVAVVKQKLNSPAPPHMYGKPLTGITTGTPVCRIQEVSLSPIPLTSKAVITPSPYQQLSHHQLPPGVSGGSPASANMTPPPAHSSRPTTSNVSSPSVLNDPRHFATVMTPPPAIVPAHKREISPLDLYSTTSSSMQQQPLDLGVRDATASKRKHIVEDGSDLPFSIGSCPKRMCPSTERMASPTEEAATPLPDRVEETSLFPKDVKTTIKAVVDMTIISSFPERTRVTTQDEQQRSVISSTSNSNNSSSSSSSSINSNSNSTTVSSNSNSSSSISSSSSSSSSSGNFINSNSNTSVITTLPMSVDVAISSRRSPLIITKSSSSVDNNISSHTVNNSGNSSSSRVSNNSSSSNNSAAITNNTTNNNNNSNSSIRWVKKAWLQRHSGDKGSGAEDRNNQNSLVTAANNQQINSAITTEDIVNSNCASDNNNGANNESAESPSSASNNTAAVNAESNPEDDDDDANAAPTIASPPLITITTTGCSKDSTENTDNSHCSPPVLVNTLHSVGSMAVNSISKIRIKNNPGSKKKDNQRLVVSPAVVVNGHISPNDESSSSDLDTAKSPKRIPPKVKRRMPRSKKLSSSSTTDSDKESGSEKDSDTSGSLAGKKLSSTVGRDEKSGASPKENTRKRGRKPKLSATVVSSSKNDSSSGGNSNGEGPKEKKSKEDNSWKDPFPKPPVGQLKKTGESFLQDGSCFEVAPKLAKCRECRWSPHQRSRNNIFCRFYAFRRLRYTKNGQLAIAGFSDPRKDPSEEDLSLWLPNIKSPPRNLDLEMARFLLYRIGYQFCELLRQEAEALSVHISEEKKIAWKRVVQGVREMCDVCETTLFNFHWACSKCGFVVCIDCYKGRKNGCLKIWGEPGKDRDDLSWLLCTNRQPHEQEKLMLTQIIAGDCVSKLATMCHESCAMWDIPLQCSCPVPNVSAASKAICKEVLNNVKLEQKKLNEDKLNSSAVSISSSSATSTISSSNGTNVVAGAVPAHSNIGGIGKPIKMESDYAAVSSPAEVKLEIKPDVDSALSWLADVALSNEANSLLGEKHRNMNQEKNSADDSSSNNRLLNGSGGSQSDLKHYVPKFSKQLKWQEPIPTRFMTLNESKLTYPGVPHSWLCDGRLLRLLDPYHHGNYLIFQDQWKRGQPIIVSDVAKKLDSSLWHPDSFAKDFGDIKNDLINCMNGNVVSNQPMRKFWEGFEYLSKRMKDEKGTAMLLKLKDWPTGEDFAEMLPSRYMDLMNCLPLNEYTHRYGKLNLASRLPECFVRPDLGPKMYNAYGSALYPNKGTTNLHLDISDAINLMVYVGIPKDGDNEEFIKEAYRAIDEAGCDILTRRRVREKGELPGAIWHIYHASEADKIRDLLNKVALEQGVRLQPHHDPIHDQSWYLDGPLRERLYKEYAVESYAIVQCLGDAVFIPAGAPHQVRNLHNCIKVAEDFVSPENVSHCFHLTQEFRDLSDTHSNHEDKLQIKNIMYHAVKDSLSVLGAAYANYTTANADNSSLAVENSSTAPAINSSTNSSVVVTATDAANSNQQSSPASANNVATSTTSSTLVTAPSTGNTSGSTITVTSTCSVANDSLSSSPVNTSKDVVENSSTS